MNAKTYLRQIKWADLKIDQKKFQLKGMVGSYNYISGIDYARDKVQTSPHDSLAEQVVRELSKIEKTRKRIIDMIGRFEEQRALIIDQIQNMEKPEHSALLFKVYVEYKDLFVTALEMDYSYRYVVNMHGLALQAFERQYLQKENPGA